MTRNLSAPTHSGEGVSPKFQCERRGERPRSGPVSARIAAKAPEWNKINDSTRVFRQRTPNPGIQKVWPRDRAAASALPRWYRRGGRRLARHSRFRYHLVQDGAKTKRFILHAGRNGRFQSMTLLQTCQPDPSPVCLILEDITNMTSKQEILGNIRQHSIPEAQLPDLNQDWIAYPDKPQQFADLVHSVGGRCVTVPDLTKIQADLADSEIHKKAKKIFSTVTGVGPGNVNLDQVDDPHQLEDLDLAVLPGDFAVAENGAIWVTDRTLKHRVVYFIAQHLVLVIHKDQILDNMHQAYARLAFTKPGFGAFISGPSKTADIEQSLVIGAHGARSLTVYVIETT